MPRERCIKCEKALEQDDGRGRPRSYCSKGCRRAAEYELRRLDSRISKAEFQVVSWRRYVEGESYYGGDPEVPARKLAWWRQELERREGRLRDILEARPE